jgi:hypothetical protein
MMGWFLVYSFYFVIIANSSPRRKMAVFMGLALLPFAITYVLNLVFDFLFFDFVLRSGSVYLLTAVACSIGLLTVVLLLLYNSNTLKKVPMEEPEPARRRRFLFRPIRQDPIVTSKISLVVCIVVIVLLMGSGVFSAGMGMLSGLGSEDKPKEIPFNLDTYDVDHMDEMIGGGYLEEQTSSAHEYMIGLEERQLLRSLKITVTWEDEPDKEQGVIGVRNLENQPDSFSLDIQYLGDPDNPSETAFSESEGPASNSKGSSGIVTFFEDFDHTSADSLNGTGDWVITVTCENAGDYEGRFTNEADDGNNYIIEVELRIYVPPSEEM